MNYTGGCHCGGIAFSLETEEPISEVMECNCSICSKRDMAAVTVRCLDGIDLKALRVKPFDGASR